MTNEDILLIGGMDHRMACTHDAEHQIDLTGTRLPVSVYVGTMAYGNGTRRMRLVVTYAITVGEGQLQMPVMYSHLYGFRDLDMPYDNAIGNWATLVRTIDERVSWWHEHIMHAGKMSAGAMSALVGAWCPQWVETVSFDEATSICTVSGPIKQNAIHSHLRTDTHALSGRELQWAVDHLVAMEALPKDVEEDDWDDAMADRVMQIALLGELVYG